MLTVADRKPIPPPLRGQALEEALKHQAVKLPVLPARIVKPTDHHHHWPTLGEGDHVHTWGAAVPGDHFHTASPTTWEESVAQSEELLREVRAENDGTALNYPVSSRAGISATAAAAIEAEPFEQAARPYAMSCEKCRLTPPRGFLNAAATRFFCGTCYRGGAR